MKPLIVDPIPSPRRTLPIMQSIQDAARLNVQEGTTFYVSAFLFQAWLCELTLANLAQIAEQPDPTQRSFQSGQAWAGFQKFFGKATDREIPAIFSHLMEFAQCDDLMAAHILRSNSPLSVEHELTADFVGPHAPARLLTQPEQAIALMRATFKRLCDWLDSELHLRVLQEWHLMPDCFDPDPRKREMACLGINHRQFDQMSQHSQAHFLSHLADAALLENKRSNWDLFHQTADNPPPQPRPWPTEDLDTAII